MDDELYMTDDEYAELLVTARRYLDEITDKDIKFRDNTGAGNKSTTSTVGLCNTALEMKRVALFPDQFDQGKTSMKYFQEHQLCPIDSRVGKSQVNLLNGCFYTCRGFQRKYKLRLKEIKAKYDRLIEGVGEPKSIRAFKIYLARNSDVAKSPYIQELEKVFISGWNAKEDSEEMQCDSMKAVGEEIGKTVVRGYLEDDGLRNVELRRQGGGNI